MGNTSAEIRMSPFPLVRTSLCFSANGAGPRRTGLRGYTLGYISKIIYRWRGDTQDQLTLHD
jgi:hypothetical protein